MNTALDVKRQLLKVDKVIGETTERKIIDSEITLPIQATKIFDIVANLTNVKGEVKEGGVMVTGIIKKQLFVVDEGNLVKHVPEEVPFRQFVDVEGAQPNLNEQIRVNIIDIESQLVTDTKVRQEVLLEIFVKVTEVQQLKVVTDVTGGPKDLEVDKKLLKVDSVVGEDRVSETIKKTAELPITAKKIFQIVGEVRDEQTEVKEDVVIVRGVVHKQIFLVDEGDLVRHVTEDVPFSVTVDIPGAQPDFDVQVDVEAVVDEFQLEDPPGRNLRQTIVLDIFVKVSEVLQKEVVIDVSGTSIQVDKKLLKVEQVVADVTERETINSDVELTIGAEKIFRIISEITDEETDIENGKVIVRAVLHKQIFFVDQNGLLRHQREDVPFQIVANVPEAVKDMNVQVRLRLIGDIDFDLIDKKKVSQTAVIEAFIKVSETEQIKVVLDVTFEKPPKPPKDYKVIVVKKGDTLYKIAKREGVTVEEILEINPDIKDPNKIFPGQEIKIPVKK